MASCAGRQRNGHGCCWSPSRNIGRDRLRRPGRGDGRVGGRVRPLTLFRDVRVACVLGRGWQHGRTRGVVVARASGGAGTIHRGRGVACVIGHGAAGRGAVGHGAVPVVDLRCRGRGRRSSAGAAGDAELSRVLVCAVAVLDELNSVSGRIGLETHVRSPAVGAGVGDVLDNRIEGNHICAGAAQEQNRHRALTRRLFTDSS